MSLKGTSKGSEKDIASKLESSPNKFDVVSRRSLITSQDELDAILNDFKIIGVKTIPPGDNDTIQNPPEAYLAYTAIHIWNEGFIPFPEFLLIFLSYLGIAPIQSSPNVYTYLISLELMALESGIPSLSAEVFTYLIRLIKLSNLNSQIF